jgi:CDP-glucose 4,6-dehydratase
MAFCNIFRGKRALVTGHTGFKGAWLSEWLLKLGAEVSGLALQPPTQPSLFEHLSLDSRMAHHLGDIRDFEMVRRIVTQVKPEFLFHLAAQPLVRLSYREPLETYATNVMGTAHILEAVRQSDCSCVVVAVTTDKCYENREWVHSYREEDPVGGFDPYSSSKGAAELIIAAYRRSYFSGNQSPVRLASARAGNVIGGGDWALDRIVPDCIRNLQAGRTISVRNRNATRPWQHVLEPLSGYLWLAARLSAHSGAQLSPLASSFNFGPNLTSNRSVADLVAEILKHCPGNWEDLTLPNPLHEASLLNLAIDKAFHHLGWQPVWDFPAAVKQTIDWYLQAALDPKSAVALTQNQIVRYAADAQALNLAWATDH